jgi:hypothetical protein
MATCSIQRNTIIEIEPDIPPVCARLGIRLFGEHELRNAASESS